MLDSSAAKHLPLAASHDSEMVRDAFEPATECCIYQGSAGATSQIVSQGGRLSSDLREVIALWQCLLPEIRSAVLTVVRAACASRNAQHFLTACENGPHASSSEQAGNKCVPNPAPATF